MFSNWDFPAGALEPVTEVQCEDDDNCFECSRCNKAYKTLKSLRRHRFHCGRIFSPTARGLEEDYDENDDRAQFQCVYCNRAYRWKKGLKRHQQRCEIKMSQEVPSENNLEVNIIEENSDADPNEPEIDIIDDEDDEINVIDVSPARKFTEQKGNGVDNQSRYSASEIERNREGTIGRFQCILCGKKYGWLKNLRRHQRICRKKVNKLRWKECKVMLEPLTLKTTKRVAEQNFKCSNCFEQFKWLKELRQHQSICSKKAQNLWNVSEAGNSRNQTRNPSLKISAENSNHMKLDPCYKCIFCGKEYKWRRSLRRHHPKCTERDSSLNSLKQAIL